MVEAVRGGVKLLVLFTLILVQSFGAVHVQAASVGVSRPPRASAASGAAVPPPPFQNTVAMCAQAYDEESISRSSVARRSERRSTRTSTRGGGQDKENDNESEAEIDQDATTTSRLATFSSVSDLSEYDELGVNSYFPNVRTLRRSVETYYGAWIPQNWIFDMYVFYTPFRDEPRGTCRPAIIYLHPAQVFQALPGGEYWRTCSYWATQGFLCILSAEDSGQFGTANADSSAEGLARRGLAMWRTLYAIENLDPDSVFYDRVCRKACVTGYSMGGGAAQNLVHFAVPDDQIQCQAPMHASLTTPRKVNQIDIPTLLGSSRDDTVTPFGPIGLMYALSYARPPVIQVILSDGAHIQGSLCGNSCPFDPVCCIPGITNVVSHIRWMTPFFKLHLLDQVEYAGVLWDIPGENLDIDGIGDQRKVGEVILLPRVAVSAATESVLVNENTTQVADVVIGQNTGTAVQAFRLELTGVTSASDRQGCIDMLNVESEAGPRFLYPGQSATFSATISADVGFGTNCTIGFQLFSSLKSLSSLVEVPITVECEWSQWSEWSDCECCDEDGENDDIARIGQVAQSRMASRSRLEAPLRILNDVDRWSQDDDAGDSLQHAARWMRDRGGDATMRLAAAREVASVLNSDASFGSSVDCQSVMDVVDFNEDGVVGIVEAETALEFAALWLSRDNKSAQQASRSAGVGATGRYAALARTHDADMDDLEALLRTVREATTLSTDTEAAPQPESEGGDEEIPPPGCYRERTLTRSQVSDEACYEKLNLNSYYQTRSCTPDCPDPNERPGRGGGRPRRRPGRGGGRVFT